MTETTSFGNSRHDSEESHHFNLEDTAGIGERFAAGFADYMENRKRNAIVELLTEEFPYMADDENFVEKVASRLSDDELFADKRFVFLVMNPKYVNR